MKTRSPVAWALGSAGFVAIFAASCGITVVTPGDPGGASGAGTGGAGAGTASAGVGGEGSTAPGDKPPGDCGSTCSVPPSGETCACGKGCGVQVGGAFEKITCAPITDLQGTHKVECVCTLQDFSGVCFELDLANLCSFDKGCCAGYFSGK